MPVITPDGALKAKAKIMPVTPHIAESLLARNTHNRSVLESRVLQYAADMRNGDWQFNGETIKIAETGQILDGQHRLLAVLEASVTVTMLVITGLPPSAQETMDQNRPRSFSDVLKLRGESDYNNLGAAVRMVGLYERDGVPFSGGRQPLTVQQLLRVLERNADIRASVAFAERHRLRPLRWLNVSMVAGMHYLFSYVDPDAADDFMVRLLDGTAPGHPADQLRERLIREHADPDRGLHARTKMAFIVKAWNAHRRGEPLRLEVDDALTGSGFPSIEGLVDRRAPEPVQLSDAQRDAAVAMLEAAA